MKPRILLGVTGSIACYKAPFILRLLRARGFTVPVVMTESAQKFVGRVTFEALTDAGVYDNLWARRESLSHISLLDETKLVLVAPATANIIAKAANGLADDLLSSLLLAANPTKVMFAPAMNTGMWNNPATRENIDRLKQRGVSFVEPGSGELACGVIGKGRLAEPEKVVLTAERYAMAHPALAGKKVVITAGRTEEKLDPVRVLTNRSSGRMGVEIALAFARRGADVILVAGGMSVPAPIGIKTIEAESSAKMLDVLREQEKEMDVLVMAAAVGDYMPQGSSDKKIKGKKLDLSLVKTPDILASLKSNDYLRIGFSVETGNGWENTARDKMEAKRLDAIVANPARVIGIDETDAVILGKDGDRIETGKTGKEELAREIVNYTINLLKKKV